MEDVLRLADRYGVALVGLLVMCMFFWQVCRWLRPWIETLITSHVAFVEKVGTTQDDLVQRNATHSETLNHHGETLKSIERKIDDLPVRLRTDICKITEAKK